MTSQVRVELEVPGRCRTVNAERSGGRWVHRQHTRETRELAGWLAKGLQPMGVVSVTAYPFQSRGPLADAGNHLPTVKAVVDGLVDAGVLVDDGPAWVTSVQMFAPTRGADRMVVVLSGLPRNTAVD